MKTKLLLLLFLANFSIYAQYITLTDINFENKLIELGIDSGVPDGKVLLASAYAVTDLDLSNSSINYLNGIQNFYNLKNLNISHNNLASVPLITLTKLESIDCSYNKLSALNINSLTQLKTLICGNNKITSLTINSAKLDILKCDYNELSSLSTIINPQLTYLNCAFNKITSLDVTNNPLLKTLIFEKNNITNINLSKNAALELLSGRYNSLVDLDVSKNILIHTFVFDNNQIRRLNLSQNTALKYADCSYNKLISLNLKNGKNTFLTGFNATNNPNLTCILVDNTAYSNVNWQTKKDNTTAYNDLTCGPEYTAIPDINFEKALISKGIDFGVPDGKVITSAISTVTDLELYNKSISSLIGIEDFTSLTVLICGSNQLTSLDLSKNTQLKQLECYQNKLTSLDLTSNPNLWYLDCFTNQLTTLDLSQNKLLKTVYCYDNLLTNLNVSGLKKLESLDCPDNQLENLDISTNTALRQIHCYRNKLKSLDVSKNISLTDVVCYSNELTYLNLKNGNNTNFVVSKYATIFKNNPKLTCIEVDNVSYSNTNWLETKDSTASFSVSCEIPDSTYVSIADQNFEQNLIDLGIDTDGLNGKISTADINSITTLDLSNSYIKDLSGIENFTALRILDCSFNQLTSLDLSQNTNLEILYITGNPLVYLNLKNGNNKNLITASTTGRKVGSIPETTFLGLTALGCIKVDDAAYSNKNWSKIKETITTFSETCTLGLEDTSFNKAIVYPNPTKGELNIKNLNLEKANVYNTLGQLVKSFTLNSGNTDNSINLSGLPKGIYYVYLINGDAASAKKIVVE